jgi:phosphatidylethanolamine-binding protein (PEBP) family uncharacterized protein
MDGKSVYLGRLIEWRGFPSEDKVLVLGLDASDYISRRGVAEVYRRRTVAHWAVMDLDRQ